MSLKRFIEDDDFDWEAAVSEIDKVCTKAEVSGAGAGIQSSQPQSTQRLKQKTLDSFIREGKAIHQLNNGKREQKISGFPVRGRWNQGHQFDSGKEHQKSSELSLGERRNPGHQFIDKKQKEKILECSLRENGNQGNQLSSGNPQQKRAELPIGERWKQDRVETSGFGAQHDHPTGNLEEKFRCEVPFDPVTARSWIYPANVPCRTYQFNITKVALFSNTLVSLPTGLGKTLIAAAVMYNYFRWFPTGKIIFAAPSRPLVVQQIEACHKVVGIPQDMTIDMTGDMSPSVRAEYWLSRRVFFVTPQCLEKDIQSGTCALRQIVCLVIDEAHRATGNYSYCVIVRQLRAAKVTYRLLALTATPGSKQVTIQAVVDNLQISCLEYRNEDDPDVSQYTHNRKVELIEVPMNSDTNQVKDLLVEVLQPTVFRLCGFRVFYNREIARLTPYEFIQAREKFRQSPPPNIPQNEYSQVEMYFGLAITLTHILKLLFTHGMRPAYEMLQQKLQQGILKRLQGNENIRHLQSVMKQTVGHGAPSPKLEKVVEIIGTHFSAHDPTKTRVIIFTNFRESVKDIMEILAAKCTDVKAMEFIGQSSGKASKGQSQKTQQAVLQKFRAGGFNAIVATSIAEEGLDIMEVDLVICFDANISPLRMIQRMGRTGRKRDGRVVVLACEGAEKEGYLAKLSRNKALNKHMVNGGLFSFNFHPSSHMIPHSYRPEVQLVELAIEDFVPRTKKLKAKQSEANIGCLRSLSEEELQLLEKYKILSREQVWKPSLISFPLFQLVPTPVHRVKHSQRTSLLIDALRCLQETSAQVTGMTQNPGEEKVNAPAEGIVCSRQEYSVEVPETDLFSYKLEKCDAVHAQLENDKGRELSLAIPSHGLNCTEDVHGYKLTSTTAMNEEVKSAPQCATSATTKENLAPKPVSELGERKELVIVDLDKSPATRCRLVQDVREVGGGTGGVTRTLTDDQNGPEIVNTPQVDTGQPALEKPLVEDNTCVQVTALGSHRCKYSSGVVYTTESGLIIIASPPTLPSGKSHRKRFTTSGGTPPSHEGTSSPGFKLAGSDLKSLPTVKFKAVKVKSDGIHTSESALAGVRQNDYVNVVSPIHKLPQVIRRDRVVVRGQKSDVEPEKVSSRLAVIASQGVVPSSPVAQPILDHGYISHPDLLKTPSVCTAGPDDVQRPSNAPQEHVFLYQSTPRTPVSTSGTFLNKKDSHSQIRRLTTDSTSKKTPLSSFLCRINCMSPPKGKILRFSEDCADHVREDASVSSGNKPLPTSEGHDFLEGHNLPSAMACPESIATPQGRSQKSPSEEWQITEGKGSASVQRPRKLKRLCKAGEKSKRPSATLKFNQLKEVGLCGSKSSRSELKAGKNQRKLLVRDFFEEEAEVSEDDESSDQYDSEEDEEEETDGFIDSAGTQHLNGTVDMMAVYRRSLLTQSPADLSAQYGHLMRTSPTTCSDGTPGSSKDLSVQGPALVSPVDSLSLAKMDSDGRKPDLNQGSRFIQKSVASAEARNIFSSSLSAVIFEDHRKLELRKRKLSFQSITDDADLSGTSWYRPQKEDELSHRSDSDMQDAREAQGTRPADMNPVLEFEDDLFDGVDLDALEAEAAQTCRVRSQQVVNGNQEVRQKQDLDDESYGLKAHPYGTVASKPRILSRLRKDDTFGGCPSFDLGLAD